MATSGARLQLAIAPAGTGKTTAMHALARAWTGDGGHLVGLAPSAAAAAQLRDQIDAPDRHPGQARLVHRPPRHDTARTGRTGSGPTPW